MTGALLVGFLVAGLVRLTAQAVQAATRGQRVIRYVERVGSRDFRATRRWRWRDGAAWVRAVPARVAAAAHEGRYEVNLAAALDAAGRGVRSGASLRAAVAEGAAAVRGPVADDLQSVVVSAERGLPLTEALDRWAERRPRASVRLAAGALALASETGGPPGRVLDDVAAALRQRTQVEREAHSLAAQARMSAVVVAVAPIAFTVVACLADPGHARVLFATPVGLTCVALGLSLDAIGALWMHRIGRSVTTW